MIPETSHQQQQQLSQVPVSAAQTGPPLDETGWWSYGDVTDEGFHMPIGDDSFLLDQPLIAEQPTDSRRASNAVSTSKVACVPCRNRHLKCDGGTCCTRCQSEGFACFYLKSRRGWKGPRRPKVAAVKGSKDDLISKVP